MKRLVFLTQAYDPGNAILGVTRDWVAALAERCAGVDVIAASVASVPDVPPNVRVASLGKERGATKLSQLVALYRSLAAALPGAGAVFVHMVPRYAVLAFPLAAVARKPIALWYAQGGVDRWLRRAARLVDRIFTPTRDSFPLAGPQLERSLDVIGHGIDTGRYAPDGTTPATPRRLLAAGRLSPSKRYDLLLDAVACLPDRSWRLRIAGGPLYDSDCHYEAGMRVRADRLQVAREVEFAGPLPYEQMPAEYRTAWALAHTSATGSLDKVVLEAMACGTPVISTAPSSRTALGPLADAMWCASDRPDAIAAHLDTALRWSPEHRSALGDAARRQVEQHHSLPRWADQVVDLLRVR
ncbi:MAG: glycosyltransferase family 4 protein [Chloroflexota bacterium]